MILKFEREIVRYVIGTEELTGMQFALPPFLNPVRPRLDASGEAQALGFAVEAHGRDKRNPEAADRSAREVS